MVRTLFSVKSFSGSSNPYVRLLVESLPTDVVATPFSWRTALLGPYDVLHVHWPEYLFRSRRGARRVVKSALALGLITRIIIRRTPVVLTVHNLRPHETGSSIEALLAQWLERLTDIRIYLNESEENDLARGVVVLHAAYPERPRADEERDAARKILFFGQLRPYKGLEDLLAAFREVSDGELVIAGAAAVPEYAYDIERVVTADERVELRIGHLSDDELAELLHSSDLVTLPYKYLYNSGAAVMALGAGKTILVPSSGSTRALAREVGGEWVSLFDAPLAAADLEAGLASAASHGGSDRPNLSKRESSLVGNLHAAVYEALLAAGRGGPGRSRRRADALRRIRADRRFREHSELNR
ncbi:glycosyltransferase [Rathayibacter sp. SD072]|uniref:glycosyltransferase n=1 Tax=Rathayibacter sp. SD072 TaxID=2781731 RepID=UPI001A96BF20|nr:glycosyltransferase [Rathayibacter sp. SD072]MBO0982878.1 glycosyltransferase [Rathayibacter sp. SD072]